MSGAPGSGKSTVARELSARLRIPALSYDAVKETLADSLGVGDPAWNARLATAADDVFFTIAGELPEGILDHWWRGDRRARLTALGGDLVEVFCRCGADALVERARIRAEEQTRHPVHEDWMPDDLLGRWEGIPGGLAPLDVGAPVLEVETDRPVDVDSIHRWVDQLLTGRHGS